MRRVRHSVPPSLDKNSSIGSHQADVARRWLRRNRCCLVTAQTNNSFIRKLLSLWCLSPSVAFLPLIRAISMRPIRRHGPHSLDKNNFYLCQVGIRDGMIKPNCFRTLHNFNASKMVCNPHLISHEHADNLESDYLLGRAVHASPSFGRHALESAMLQKFYLSWALISWFML